MKERQNKLTGPRILAATAVLFAAEAVAACSPSTTETPKPTIQPTEKPTPSLMATPSASAETTPSPVATVTPTETPATPEPTPDLVTPEEFYKELKAIKTPVKSIEKVAAEIKEINKLHPELGTEINLKVQLNSLSDCYSNDWANANAGCTSLLSYYFKEQYPIYSDPKIAEVAKDIAYRGLKKIKNYDEQLKYTLGLDK